MRVCKIIVPLLLILILLAGCSEEAAKDITLYSGMQIVISENADDTVLQAANCLQVYYTGKTNLPMPSIVRKDPGSNAIVLQVDTALGTGVYQMTTQNGSLYVTAGDAHSLLYAVKQLRQALIDSGNPTAITTALCQSLSGSVPADNLPFTVVTQNILSKDAAGGNTLVERAPRFQQLVMEYQPDILAIQESNTDWQNYYNLYFAETYIELNKEKVTFLLRADRYTVEEQGFFYLSPTPEVYSQFEGDSGPRACCWAVVTDQIIGKTFLLYNTHLDWNNDTQRALQFGVLLEQLGPYFEKYPTIGCGDFNSERESVIYSTATQHFADSAQSAARKLSTIDYTCHSFGETQKYIDYIFHEADFQADSHYIINDMYSGYVSDHYGVVTQFQFAQ